MNKGLLRFRLLGVVAVSAVILAIALVFVAKAAGNNDFRYGSAQYKGLVNDCSTSATVGLTKAGFNDVNSEVHPSNSAVYGTKGNYIGVVLCTKAQQGLTYSEVVFGPSGSELSALFKALDADFK